MTRTFAWLGLAAAGLCGCATAWVPGELRIAPDAYRVRHAGDYPRCRDHALLRSAQLAVENGYRYFIASTPEPDAPKNCEVRVRMFVDRPECDY